MTKRISRPLTPGFGVEDVKMISNTRFEQVVSSVKAGTKNNQINISHTWYGWTSKGVLHVTSTSGARRHEIWHFDIEKNAGKNMFFKNTTGTADCWTKSAGNNKLEKFVMSIDPLVRVDYVKEIHHKMYQRGSNCSHSTYRGGNWWYITTDGQESIISESPRVGYHSNQYHQNCPIRADEVLVTGGSFAVNWSNERQIKQVYIAEGADLEYVLLQISVEMDLWRMIGYEGKLKDPWWDKNLTIEDFKNRRLELLKLAAEGKLLPQHVKTLTKSAKPYYTLEEGIDPEIFDQAMFHHPVSILRRKLTDEIVSIISNEKKFGFFLTNQRGDEDVIILPKGQSVWWEKTWEKDGNSGGITNEKISSWRGNGSPAKETPHLPEWAIKNIRLECERTPTQELENVPDNILLANNLAIKVKRSIQGMLPISQQMIWREKNGIVFLKNGSDPSQGFGRVPWNKKK